MKILMNSTKDLLDPKLDITHRGILATILICREANSKMTLAKCKVSFPIKNYTKELIFLHENNFIKWSGYNRAKKTSEKVKSNPDAENIINFMNDLYGRKFQLKTYSNMVTSLLKDNPLEDIKLVISNRYSVWKHDSFMEKYLTPSTIFKPSKFNKYLEEAKHTRIGESIVNVDKFNLKDNDEVTTKIAKTFVDKDTYVLKIYNTDSNGNKRGSGKAITRYGKDIKKLIHVQDSNEKFNGVREYLYFYSAN
jgi:uncharacterized phage protein (TIGR02220 family)